MAQEGAGRAGGRGLVAPGSSVVHRLSDIRHRSLPARSQVSCAYQLCSPLPAFLINGRQIRFLKKKGPWEMESLQEAAGWPWLTGRGVQRWGSPLREGNSLSGPRDHLLRGKETSKAPGAWGWAWPLWPLEQLPTLCSLFRGSLQGSRAKKGGNTTNLGRPFHLQKADPGEGPW